MIAVPGLRTPVLLCALLLPMLAVVCVNTLRDRYVNNLTGLTLHFLEPAGSAHADSANSSGSLPALVADRHTAQLTESRAWWPNWPSLAEVDAFESAFKTAEAITELQRAGDRRPSTPIITGDGFMGVADLTCGRGACSGAVEAGRWAADHPGAVAVVFLEGTGMRAFLDGFLPSLRNATLRFVLVIHNSDEPVPVNAADAGWLDEPLLVACFAQNAMQLHPRLVPIP